MNIKLRLRFGLANEINTFYYMQTLFVPKTDSIKNSVIMITI